MNKKAIVENVANLNGIIGPLLFEYHRNGTVACAATLQIEAAKPTFKYWKTGHIREEIARLEPNNLQFPHDFAFLALLLESQGLDGATHRFQQVCSRSWISPQESAALVTSLSSICGEEVEFESPFYDPTATQGKILTGRVDIIDHSKQTIIEVKYAESISDAHLIQALLYWYLAVKNDGKYRNYTPIVVNIRDGTRVELHPGLTDSKLQTDPLISMQTLVHFLVDNKYASKKVISDKDFMQNTSHLIENGFDPSCMEAFEMILKDEESTTCLFSDEDD